MYLYSSIDVLHFTSSYYLCCNYYCTKFIMYWDVKHECCNLITSLVSDAGFLIYCPTCSIKMAACKSFARRQISCWKGSITTDVILWVRFEVRKLDVPLMLTTKAFLKIATTSPSFRDFILHTEVIKYNEPSCSWILVFIFRYTGLPVQFSVESYCEIICYVYKCSCK